MSPNEIRETLISRTISIIANEGLDKTTTKAITTGTGINEAYIYRCFKGKEDLLAKTFDKLDYELIDKTNEAIDCAKEQGLEGEARYRCIFNTVWRFMLGNEEKCLAFIRYFYSPYFLKNSADDHETRYIPLTARFKKYFKEEANVWMLLNHILNVLTDFAVKVFSNQVGDNDDTAEHVFRLVYYSVSPYLK